MINELNKQLYERKLEERKRGVKKLFGWEELIKEYVHVPKFLITGC